MAGVGCVCIPRVPLAVELAARPQLRGLPVVVAHPRRPEVGVASPEAERWGILAGQSLSEAIARCPELEVVDARPSRCASLAEEIVTRLETVAPGVEPVYEGLSFVDLRGLVGVHGGEAPMQAALLGSVPAGLGGRLGIAPFKIAARLAALSAEPGTAVVLDAERTGSFMAAQPITALDLEAETVRRLHLLGLRTLADVRAVGAAALTAQFGPVGRWLADLVSGRRQEPVRPRAWQEEVREELDLETPLATAEPLVMAVNHLLVRATTGPAFAGRAARQFRLVLETEHDRRWERVITFKEALSEAPRIADMVRPQLLGAQLPGAVIHVSLELRELVWAQGWQVHLLSRQGEHRTELEEGLRKLRARYGHCPVERIVEVEPWNRIPERRRALTSFTP